MVDIFSLFARLYFLPYKVRDSWQWVQGVSFLRWWAHHPAGVPHLLSGVGSSLGVILFMLASKGWSCPRSVIRREGVFCFNGAIILLLFVGDFVFFSCFGI